MKFRFAYFNHYKVIINSHSCCWASWFHACCTSAGGRGDGLGASSKTSDSTSGRSGRGQTTEDCSQLHQYQVVMLTLSFQESGMAVSHVLLHLPQTVPDVNPPQCVDSPSEPQRATAACRVTLLQMSSQSQLPSAQTYLGRAWHHG